MSDPRGCPTGTADDWRARYTSMVGELLRHRGVTAPRISAVVVAWKSADFVVGCVDCLREQHGLTREDVEIVLVDNGGLERARVELADRVDTELRMAKNVGLSRARNAGLAWASAPLVAYIDDDGLVLPDYLSNAIAYFDDASIVGVRSRIVAKHHPYFTLLGDHYDRGPKVVDDCLVTEGSCVVRRDAVIAAGGFAETLSPHEGLDLTFRLKNRDASSRVVYAPDVIMRHDFIDGWPKFVRKALAYSGAGDHLAAIDPDLGAFIDAHARRRFPRTPLAARERVARAGLTAIRSALRIAARLTGRQRENYIRAE